MNKKRVAIIGCGALGSVLAAGIKELLTEDYIITGVMANHYEKAEAAAKKTGCKAFKTLELLLEDRPDYVVEAAGGEAVCAYGEQILLTGSNLIVLSAGALADKVLYNRLYTAAQKGGCALYIASGAIGS